jgi:hypothetical protein
MGVNREMEISGMSKKNVWIAVALSALVVAAPMSALAKKKQHTGVGPGMNEAGEVVDSSEVESGWGEEVVGVNDYEGEITGKPAPGSKFTQLKIGMPMKQVTDLIGEPTDQGAYVTGKAFIPFFFGGDQYRYEMAYKGQGRLVFAGKSMGTGGNLIWIIHNKDDSGYRE